MRSRLCAISAAPESLIGRELIGKFSISGTRPRAFSECRVGTGGARNPAMALILALVLVLPASFGHQMSSARITGLIRVFLIHYMMMNSMFRIDNDKGHGAPFPQPKAAPATLRGVRARFVEGCTTEEAARRFGYSHGSFRNLCSQFINAEDPDFLFPAPAKAKPPEAEPADRRAERRQRVLDLRRQGLSIHDICKRLADEGSPLSVGTIQKLLSDAGISKLPRRRPDQMPAVEQAPVADR